MDTHEWLKFLERAVEQSSDGIAIVDKDEKVVYMNRAWIKIHGIEPSDYNSILGHHLGIFHTSEQLDNEVLPAQQIVREKGFYQGEIGHKRKDGSIFPTLMTTTLVRDEKGNILGYIGTANDISEQKRIQEIIAVERKVFNEVIDNMPFAMVIYDKEGHILKGNKVCQELFGPLPPSSYSILKDPLLIQGGWITQLLQEIERKRVFTVNKVHYNPRNLYSKAIDKDLILNAIAFPIFDAKGNLQNFITIFEDITEKIRTEEELARKDLDVQFSSVISMISSMFIHDSMKIDENIYNSFKTLGYAIDCDFIAIFNYNDKTEHHFQMKWHWTPMEIELDQKLLIEMLDKPILEDYWNHPPQNLFLQKQYKQKKKSKAIRNSDDFNIYSLLLVPIYQGKDRFGIMLLNRRKEKPNFSTREISLSLQVSILISLALKNEMIYNRSFI